MKNKVHQLALSLNEKYRNAKLANWNNEWFWTPSTDDEKYPPKTTFNLISALHHISGTMAFTFECSHGSVSEKIPEPIVNYSNILDIQLILYNEMFDYVLKE